MNIDRVRGKSFGAVSLKQFKLTAFAAILPGLLFCGLAHEAVAVPIGGPLDGQNHVVHIFESAGEGIDKVAVATEGGMEQFLTPKNGSFIIPFPIQPGSVVFTPVGADTGSSDTITLARNDATTTKITGFLSDSNVPGMNEDTGAEIKEPHAVSDDAGHTLNYFIDSPAEPTPEPATLLLWGTLAGLGIGVRWTSAVRIRRKSREGGC